MSATKGSSIPLPGGMTLEVYYDRETRSWWGFYGNNGVQIGDAWFGFTRDEVLVHRPH